MSCLLAPAITILCPGGGLVCACPAIATVAALAVEVPHVTPVTAVLPTMDIPVAACGPGRSPVVVP